MRLHPASLAPSLRAIARSYSLVELLVVMAAVLILIAILVPAAQGYIERAKLVKCLSNIRQIGVAMESYRADHDQHYPLHPAGTNIYDQKALYMDALESNYLQGAWGVFRCPLNRNNTLSIEKRTNAIGARMDYEMNSGVFGMALTGLNQYDETLAELGLTVVLYDYPPPNLFQPAGIIDPGVEPAPHPHGGFHAYFADGHVEQIRAEEWDDVKKGQMFYYKWGRNP